MSLRHPQTYKGMIVPRHREHEVRESYREKQTTQVESCCVTLPNSDMHTASIQTRLSNGVDLRLLRLTFHLDPGLLDVHAHASRLWCFSTEENEGE